jgi:hypothetical protein
MVVAAAISVAGLLTFAGSDDSTVTPAHRNLWAGLNTEALERAGYTGRAGASTTEIVEPLYSSQDRALMAAVASGVVPQEVLESDDFRIKRLVNQGLVPKESAEP